MDTVRDKILNALTLFYQKIKSIFIQTTNVVNNCASTSTTYPLSAAQGTSLQGQIDDINSTLIDLFANKVYCSETLTLESGKSNEYNAYNIISIPDGYNYLCCEVFIGGNNWNSCTYTPRGKGAFRLSNFTSNTIEFNFNLYITYIKTNVV